jgi:hypothetical protein
VLSIVLLIAAVVVVYLGVLLGVFALALLDSCSAPRCSESAVWTAVVVPLVAAVVLGLAGMAATIVRLVRRSPAWPFALGALVVVVIVLAVGAVAYTASVG